MKLSILIPVYNWQVSLLLFELAQQAGNCPEELEILCLDDGSEKYSEQNAKTAEKLSILYHSLPNKGRSVSRNRLAEMAEGEFLLFLDCDSGIIGKDFLRIYLDFIKEKNPSVIYGGRVYPEFSPGKNYFLHWKYGKKVEAAPLEKRLKNPYLTFMSNNFVVKKKVYQQNPMNEELTEYGYEDLLWAYQLEKKGIEFHHIENPVCHEGLCSSEVFLSKTRQAIDNLHRLVVENKLEKDVTPLTRAAQQLRRLGISKIYRVKLSLLRPIIEWQLRANQPSLFIFNLWKLWIYLEFEKKDNR